MRGNKSDGAPAIPQAATIGQVSLQKGCSHATGIGWVSTQMPGRIATNRYTIRRPFRIRCRRLCTKIAPCVSAGVPITSTFHARDLLGCLNPSRSELAKALGSFNTPALRSDAEQRSFAAEKLWLGLTNRFNISRQSACGSYQN
jgi:hypothetical protein